MPVCEQEKVTKVITIRVEHIFAALKRIFKFTRLRYRGLERVTTKFESLIIAYNFYRLGFLMRNQRITAKKNAKILDKTTKN